ncbi:hypothetical protein C0992_000230, partial [Termitomyces sp. T32_za158]
SASASATTPPPAQRGLPSLRSTTAGNTTTDARTIASTAHTVDQKAGAGTDAPPDLPVPATSVTALDGRVVNASLAAVAAPQPQVQVQARAQVGTRERAYVKVFDGATGHDAAVEGTAYLTYTLVSNATYNVPACLAFCDVTPGCVFVNLYYELNNPLLDFVFTEKSNLKCAAYGDTHTASEKTNFGGQQLAPLPAPASYIARSSGWSVDALVGAPVPDGYELVFGPTDGANNAPGYMGFAFIDKYDASACAALCNARDADTHGGACAYFNIWRALVDGVPTTYTCAFYYIPTDASTAVNYGQGSLKVTYSRGYRRTSLAVDGGFEGFTCASADEFCFAGSSGAWNGTSGAGGTLDASVFHYAGYARSGAGVGLLGSANGVDTLSGTLSPALGLQTVAGRRYLVTFFANTLYAGAEAEAGAYVDVLWNGDVAQSMRIGYRDWTYYETTVVARGNDGLGLHGGAAPAIAWNTNCGQTQRLRETMTTPSPKLPKFLRGKESEDGPPRPRARRTVSPAPGPPPAPRISLYASSPASTSGRLSERLSGWFSHTFSSSSSDLPSLLASTSFPRPSTPSPASSPKRALGPAALLAAAKHGKDRAMRYLLDPDAAPPDDSTAPIWILGVPHDPAALDADFASRIWLTYRSHFPPIRDVRLADLDAPSPQIPRRTWVWADKAWSSDTGWGCMLRTGQSLLANALVHLHLGRDWRRPSQPAPTPDYATYVRILTWFLDDPAPDAPFSVHRMALAGKELGKDVGQWFGPSTAAGAIKCSTPSPNPSA